MDTLFVCLDYRNRAAHGGRIYNFTTDAKFRYNPLLHVPMLISQADYRTGKGSTGLVALAFSVMFLDNKNPATALVAAYEMFLEEHCDIYPNDRSYLEQYMKIPH